MLKGRSTEGLFMAKFKDRFHEYKNKVFNAEANIHIIEDSLNAVRNNKEVLNLDNLIAKANDAISNLQEADKELKIIRSIFYKTCNPNEDLDHLIISK